MTAYDALKGDVLADVDSVYQVGVADGTAAQQAADAPMIAGLNATVAQVKADDVLDKKAIADLEAQIAALQQSNTTPPPVPSSFGFGLYDGQFSAAQVKTDVGKTPKFSTYYYQTSGTTPAALQVAKHQAELDQGITQVIDLDWKASSMTIAQVAAGKADAAITSWLKDLKTLSDYAKAKGTEVWFSFVHEAVVHINGAKFAAGAVTTSDMAAAWNRVMDLAAAAAPNARRTYWFGGMEKKVNGVAQGVVFGDSLNPAHIQAVTFDPYLFDSHSATETPQATFGGTITALQSKSWFKGRPWGLTEFGASVGHGDASNATWITAAVALLKANGASIAVYFNRNTDQDYRVTTATTPKSLAALKAALTT